ncbi:DUF4424 family protein [Xanthobacter sp. V4C-4]|uniref:DUF4424 family protein n=1 Tax=Xanthobacter cornucopiae TaxID=3119924 RepID=UPI00372C2875
MTAPAVRRLCLALALGLGLLGAAPARANDSEAAIGIGGLTLTRSEAIRLDQEDLFISRDQVRVNYVFTNTSDRDIETLVAFPLPDIVQSPITRVPDYAQELNFRTLVEGQPAQLDLVQQASFKGQDITARLKSLNLPLVALGDSFSEAVNRLPADARAALLREELLIDGGTDGKTHLWDALWTVHTSVTRRQTFPAGRSIRVEHSYRPFVGGRVGGALEPSLRRTPEFRGQRQRQCIDDDFLAGLDRRRAAARHGDDPGYSEVWLEYVLRSGANWVGPIRDFRLVIDKGNPRSLVSFCANGVKRLDDRRFEVRYQNFTPSQDLDILIVDFIR